MNNTERKYVVDLSERDVAAILFSLRYAQAEMDTEPALMRDSEHFVGIKPVTKREIDALCEHINLDGLELSIADVDMAANLTRLMLMQGGGDITVRRIVAQYDLSPDECNVLFTSLEHALAVETKRNQRVTAQVKP